MSVIDIDRNPWPAAADYIAEHGWTKGTEQDDEGRVCIQGAVRLCSPQPGDGAIHREVLIYRNKGANLNDRPDTTLDDILGYLRRDAAPITDDELQGTFGPQWLPIVGLIHEVGSWSPERIQAFRSAAWAAYNDPPTGYRDAYHAVVVGGGPGGAALRALGAVGGGFVNYAGVATALARRHEVAAGSVRLEHYKAIARVWVDFTGTPLHPDDTWEVLA